MTGWFPTPILMLNLAPTPNHTYSPELLGSSDPSASASCVAWYTGCAIVPNSERENQIAGINKYMESRKMVLMNLLAAQK